MIEITTQRCFVLWTIDKRGRIRFDPTVFTNAAAVINEGERQKEEEQITDYNYSVVMCPQIGEQIEKRHLTNEARAPSIIL